MANNTLTDEERLALQQAEANAVNYGTDTSSTEQQSFKGKTLVEDVKTPTASTSTQYIEQPDVILRTNAQKAFDTSMLQSGYTKDADGNYQPKNTHLSDVIPMKKAVEDVERKNRIKTANSALYNTLSTIGDIITASAGGSVYKREKDNTIENAAKDTQARKDALLSAEQAARAADKKAFADAVTAAQKAQDDYIRTFSKKVGTTNTDEAKSTRTTTQLTPARTTQGVVKREAPDLAEVNIYTANGTPVRHSVDKAKVAEYLTAVANDLNSQALVKGSAFRLYLMDNGLWNENTNSPKAGAIKNIISNENYYNWLSNATKQMNRELYGSSKAYNDFINSAEYKAMNEYDRYQALKQRREAVFGTAAPFTINNKQSPIGRA
jgi:hypothetical protein